jgi:transcriptional regulator GlxA family with amidase domain
MYRAFSAMHDFTILLLPGAYASSVALTLDMLGTAARLAPRLKLPRPTWRVLSPDGGDVPLSNSLQIKSSAMPRRSRADASTWVIPGLGLDRVADIGERLARADAVRAIDALRRHGARGAGVAASCSGVFLLQAAGLLRQRRVTTSWWLAPELSRIEPHCRVDADRMVCGDGPVVTAGAAFAHSDLMLHLLRLRFGTRILMNSVQRSDSSRYGVLVEAGTVIHRLGGE